jgi:DNA end-binding protein Ku
MAPRANWKGYLKLSLVSCEIALYPATSASERVRFNRLNRQTGNRLKQLLVDAQTEEPVDRADQIKGYQVGKNAYVQIEDEELDAIKIESTHTIDVESFVDIDEVDKRYLDTPYYIAPEGTVGIEAFTVIRDAMRDKGKAGLGRVVISRRERMVLLEPLDNGILATLLRYPYEVREHDEYFEDIPEVEIADEMRDLAAHIVERKSAKFDPSKFEDRYENAVADLLKSKEAGGPVQVPEAPRPSNVISLMDALRQSIAAEKGGASPKASKPKAPSKTSADRAKAKEPAKDAAKKPRRARKAG